jgi:hypothetical protein
MILMMMMMMKMMIIIISSNFRLSRWLTVDTDPALEPVWLWSGLPNLRRYEFHAY